MKNLFILLIISISINSYAKEVIICGKILSRNNAVINIYEPVNGYYNSCSYGRKMGDNYKIFSDSFFYKSLNIDKPAFFDIFFYVNNQFSGRSTFLAVPGDSIHISFNLDGADKKWYLFSGSNSSANQFFNSIIQNTAQLFMPPIQKLVSFLPGNASTFIPELDKIIDNTVHPFLELYKQKKISALYCHYMTKYFATAFYAEAVHRLGNPYKTNETLDKTMRDTIMNNIFVKLPGSDPEIKGLRSSMHYIIAYYDFRAYKKMRYKYLTDFENSETKTTIKNTTITIDKLLSHLVYIDDRDAQQAIWAFYLADIFRLAKGYFNDDIIKQYEFLFDKSPYLDLLYTIYKQNLPSDFSQFNSYLPIELVDTASVINNFSDLIKKLPQNEYIFIDIWASWCGPCISEFSYNNIVDSFLIKNKISKVYISLDDPQSKSSWMNAIYKYKLGGSHILCSDKLKLSIKTDLGLSADDLMPIPRYLFINKQGKLINLNAPRPSSGNELFNQMKRDFSLKVD